MIGADEPQWPRAILFDLDGTLIDSAPDIAAAVNELLALHRAPPLALERVKAMIGGGVRKLVERAFAASGRPLDAAGLDRADREMIPIYLRNLTRLTTLMPGARDTVARLHGNGVALAVATNKPQVAARQILVDFGLIERFGAVVGGDAVTHKKPAPDLFLLALERLGVDAADALVVGDSVSDVGAARTAGIAVALIRGGYSMVPLEELGADFLCEGLADLPRSVASWRSAA